MKKSPAYLKLRRYLNARLPLALVRDLDPYALLNLIPRPTPSRVVAGGLERVCVSGCGLRVYRVSLDRLGHALVLFAPCELDWLADYRVVAAARDDLSCGGNPVIVLAPTNCGPNGSSGYVFVQTAYDL